VTTLSSRVHEAGTSLARSFANPALRRLQLAWLGSVLGNWSYIVALSVYAYGQGGANAVGFIWLVRLVPAALLAAPLATIADRYPRRRVMIVTDLLRAALMGVAAVVIAVDGPAAAVYATVVVATIVGVPFRPAQAALVPRLARDPAELTAANAASSTIESVASFAGPALGGLLLAVTTTELVFGLNGLSFLWSAALVLGVRVEHDAGEGGRRTGFLRELTAGAGTIVRDAEVRSVSLLYAAQTLVAGALNVLIVLVALELLETGEAGVGYLNAALGLGSILGGLVALAASTRGRLAVDFGIGLVLFGVPLVAIALLVSVPVALLALGVVGIGNAMVDVTAITILQRIVGDDVLGRVLGTLEGLLIGAIGLGAVLAPALVRGLGIEGALAVAGLLLPALTVVSIRGLRATDLRAAPSPTLPLLRGVGLLAPLSEPVLEHLATTAGRVSHAAGDVVIREGDVGDRFYVIEQGEVEVADTTLGPGESFGEIALLRDVPRTATVVARTAVELVTLERGEFLAAVTGHEGAHAAADEVVTARLARIAGRPLTGS
jgi:MFS family permease